MLCLRHLLFKHMTLPLAPCSSCTSVDVMQLDSFPSTNSDRSVNIVLSLIGSDRSVKIVMEFSPLCKSDGVVRVVVESCLIAGSEEKIGTVSLKEFAGLDWLHAEYEP